MLRRRLAIPILLLIVPLGSGCQRWQKTPAEWKGTASLPPPRMSPDTVVLEVAFVPIGTHENQLTSELWQEVDELVVPAETHDRLWRNGIRIGLISTSLPDKIRQIMTEKRETALQSSDDFGGITEHRLQSRLGERGTIQVGGPLESMSVFWSDEKYTRGRTIGNAQCILSVKTTPQGDGRVEIELTPEIQHGTPQNNFVGRNGAWHLRSERKREIFEKMRFKVTVAPGQSVVLSCTPDDFGLGHHFFGRDDNKTNKLLMIRLALVQLDDLFAPEQIGQPLIEE